MPLPQIHLDDYYTLAEAAERIGTDPSEIKAYARAKRIDSVKLSRNFVLYLRDSVDRFERRKRGPKPRTISPANPEH